MAIPSPQVISTVDTVSDQRLDIDGTVWQLSTNTDESVILYGITDNAGTNYEIGYLKERPAPVNFYGTMAAPAVSGETEVTTLGAIASTKFYVDYDRAFILFPNGHSTPVNVTYKGMGSIQKAKDVNEAIRAADWAVTRYLGPFTTAAEPSVDNSGGALTDGALYFNTTTNLLRVYDLAGTTWNNAIPTAAEQTNINTVGTNIASVNTTATNIADVNNFADVYQIDDFSPSAPTTDGGGNALAKGDLAFDTTLNVMKVYNGSTWIIATVEDVALLVGATFTGAVVFDNTVTFNSGIGGVTASQVLTGTITDTYFLSLAYVLTGDVTLSGNNVLGKIAGSTNVSITNDGSTRTLSGSGTLLVNSVMFN